jgi:PAS domain S-box-containing protein
VTDRGRRGNGPGGLQDPDEQRTRAELLAELHALRGVAERERLLEVVLRGVTDAITMLAADGRIVYANTAAAAQIGVADVETLLSRPYGEHLVNFDVIDEHGAPLAPERLPTRRAFRGEPVHEAPLRFRYRGEDRDRWCLISATPIFDEAGAVRHVVNIFRDISDRIDAERALQVQLRLTQTITDNATAALFLIDARQHCTYMNPAAVAMTGFTLDEVQGRPLHDFIHHHHPDGRPYARDDCRIDRALPERQQERGEDAFIRKDGRFFPIAFTASPILADGRPVGTVIEVDDISEQRQVENELRLRAHVLESMTEGVSVADERGHILYTNAAEDTMFGYAAGELLGRHVSVLNSYPEAENHRIVEAVITHLAAHGVWVGEFHNIKKDGTPFVTHARITALDLSNRRHLLCVQEDITQEKRDREALLFLSEASTMLVASLDHTRTLQELTRLVVPRLGTWCSVYLQDGAGPVELAACSHIDPERTLLIRELNARFPPDPQGPHGLPTVLRTGKSLLLPAIDDAMLRAAARSPTELNLMRELGPRSSIVVPLRAQGRTFGVLAISTAAAGRRHDAFDLALVEELARRAAVAIDNARLFAIAQKERARAEEANRAKDLFLSTLSHELRTPLTAILGWTRMLRTSTLAPEKREKGLETIDRNARAQVALIEDILDLSRIVTGKLRLELQPVELVSVIEAAVDTVRPAIDARNIRLQLALDPDAATVIGDPNRLQQIVWNLLTNAVKFTPRGGKIQVWLRREASHVEITVADDGQGIDPALLPFVFDRFRQSDASTTRSLGGLGLGLAIVKHLLELHGGTIHAVSEGQGQGATFIVRIPVAPLRSSTLPAVEHRLSPDARDLECPPGVAGLTVLVVDDEPDVREWVSALLEHCKAVVFTAGSATEALAALHVHHPDVIVSDIGMPGEDGYTLIKKIRALGPQDGGGTPAIALTAYARMEDRTRAMVAGFNMHVAKPIEPTELLITIANLTGRLSGG